MDNNDSKKGSFSEHDVQRIIARIKEIGERIEKMPKPTREQLKNAQELDDNALEFIDAVYKAAIENPHLAPPGELEKLTSSVEKFKEQQALKAEMEELGHLLKAARDFYTKRALKRYSEGSPN